jgi:hypothetical protein
MPMLDWIQGNRLVTTVLGRDPLKPAAHDEPGAYVNANQKLR